MGFQNAAAPRNLRNEADELMSTDALVVPETCVSMRKNQRRAAARLAATPTRRPLRPRHRAAVSSFSEAKGRTWDSPAGAPPSGPGANWSQMVTASHLSKDRMALRVASRPTAGVPRRFGRRCRRYLVSRLAAEKLSVGILPRHAPLLDPLDAGCSCGSKDGGGHEESMLGWRRLFHARSLAIQVTISRRHRRSAPNRSGRRRRAGRVDRRAQQTLAGIDQQLQESAKPSRAKDAASRTKGAYPGGASPPRPAPPPRAQAPLPE